VPSYRQEHMAVHDGGREPCMCEDNVSSKGQRCHAQESLEPLIGGVNEPLKSPKHRVMSGKHQALMSVTAWATFSG
jgi:hypothetical protein